MTHVTGVGKFRGGQSPDAPAVKWEVEEDWGREKAPPTRAGRSQGVVRVLGACFRRTGQL